MLGRILTNMIWVFITVNSIWWLMCGGTFMTTIGFNDRLISITKWAVNFITHLIYSLSN